ncbi:MAG TPA: hypothetical protein VF331_10020 [Polyangiales bacterium]
MATCIAWLLNLDADLELQDPASYHAPRITAQRVAELSARMADLIAADDVVLTDTWRGPLRADCVLQLFCPTPNALARVTALGLTPGPAPSLAVLRGVNSRSFCAALGHGLPGSAYVLDMAALEQQLQRASVTGSYVLKREFSFAGREQRRVHGSSLDAATRSFCARSFARGEGLQVEPWVQRLADFSRHGYLTRTGVLLMGSTREQRCDAHGRFLGMSVAPAEVSPAEAAALAAELTKTSAALAAAGYFGPFGIDGFRYAQVEGGEAFNPRCEINGRFTMGYPRALLQDALDRESAAL